MKIKRTIFLATFVVTMGLLLGANAAQAANVRFDPNNSTKAIGIENFDIDSKLYTVVFTDKEKVAEQIYGAFPGTFDFDFGQSKDAADGVNEELNAAGAQTVGAAGEDDSTTYRIGFESAEVGPSGQKIEAVFFWEITKLTPEASWVRPVAYTPGSYNTGNWIWAVFTLEGPAPPPVTIGGTVSGLEGSGLVLRNDGDDETIVADGPFEFRTPMTPNDWYNVTVSTQPTNPAQTCSVENGSGQVPEQDVTDVAVTCAAPVLGDVIIVAAAGDDIGGTVLESTLRNGGVAINPEGLVAFGGEFDEGRDAVFTQDQKVVAEGNIFPGPEPRTTLRTFSTEGEVAISADRVAFHGQDDNNTDTVFVAYGSGLGGKVAAAGDLLTDGDTLDAIDDRGKVAINNFDLVAFHGSVEIGEGPERFHAVFTASDGQDTQVVARQGLALPDNTIVHSINSVGKVAINDGNVVAFHGYVSDPDTSGDTLEAVFTSDGLVARVGDTLDDGTTLVTDIEFNGGVAINVWGDVAFHGYGGFGTNFKGVFISDGETTQVVVKAGDTLPDNTLIEEINYLGGVAINLMGDVVFHGRTGGVKAVFTQYGVVAKVGDNLADGTTLRDIYEEAGVAINPYGSKVAFHGQVDDQEGTPVDAVFVGQAP